MTIVRLLLFKNLASVLGFELGFFIPGPKDLPRLARVAGRLAGRSIGYVQMARGQFDNVMQQSQAKQVHKELQDTIAQLEAIHHEIRTISFVNPGPLTRRLVENGGQIPETNGNTDLEKTIDGSLPGPTSSLPPSASKVYKSTASPSSDMHNQAIAYARLAESAALHSEPTSNEVISELTDESGITVLPVSTQETGLLPNRKGCQGYKYGFVYGGFLGAQSRRKKSTITDDAQNCNKRTAFYEEDQENLYKLVQDKAASGKQGHGIKDQPRKVAGVRFKGKRTSFSDDEGDEFEAEDCQPSAKRKFDDILTKET